MLYIYPDKRNKASFDTKRDEILRNGIEATLNRKSDNNLKSKDISGKKLGGASGVTSQDKLDEKYLLSLLEEERKDYGNQDLMDVAKKIYEVQIPKFKKGVKQFELEKVKAEIMEEVEKSKRVGINIDVNHWKKYFLFPFAQIAPFPDRDDQYIETVNSQEEGAAFGKDASFNRLVSKKYLFPLERLAKNQDWMREL